jgi:hypothetical protein
LRALLSALGLCLFLGCAAAGTKARPRDPGLFLLAPSEAGAELSVTQSLSFSKGASHFEALAVLQVDRQAVTLVGLGPMGNRLLSLRWDGSRLDKERDPQLPKELPLELILRDVQLAYWPAEAVRRALPKGGWSLQDGERLRVLSQAGADIVRIRYQGADRWHSATTFEHLGMGYRLDITPIKDEP